MIPQTPWTIASMGLIAVLLLYLSLFHRKISESRWFQVFVFGLLMPISFDIMFVPDESINGLFLVVVFCILGGGGMALFAWATVDDDLEDLL